MKKQFTFIVSIVIASVTNAQPTLTNGGVAPLIGTNITTHYGNYIAPGPSGANQTWNFTTYSGPTVQVVNTVDPSTTPYAAQYTGSSVCFYTAASNYYQFLNDIGTSLFFIGAEATGISLDCTGDDEELFQYPLTMSNTWTDAYLLDGGSFMRNGNVTGTADAYGTLITPAGTFTNVLRIHISETFTDNATFPGTLDYYAWYKEGIHYPLFLTSSSTYNGSPYQSYAYYTDAAVGIEEQNALAEMLVYPQPAQEEFFIQLKENNSSSEYLLSDLTGRVIMTGEIKFPSTAINTSGISSGLFLLSVKTGETTLTKKIVIQ